MTKERLVREAEALFFKKGFQAVTLKEICSKLQIRPASLYHYFPGGKEEIYLEAIQLKTQDFRRAVEAISAQHKELEPLLVAFGQWYMSQSPMNMMLIAEVDVPFLSKGAQGKVSEYVGDAIFGSLGRVFERFVAQVKPEYGPGYLIATLSMLLFSAHTASRKGKIPPEKLIADNIRLFLYGAARD